MRVILIHQSIPGDIVAYDAHCEEGTIQFDALRSVHGKIGGAQDTSNQADWPVISAFTHVLPFWREYYQDKKIPVADAFAVPEEGILKVVTAEIINQ